MVNPGHSSQASICADTALNFWSLVSSIAEAKIKATNRLADIEELLLELSIAPDSDRQAQPSSSSGITV